MSANGKAQPSHLDKLLEGKPPEFQAQVLRFAVDAGMRPEDPAFRLVQYIGYLAQLTESAPVEWKDLFKRLQSELNEWSKITAEQLTTTADYSEIILNLAQACDRLGTALSALDLTSQQVLEQLKTLIEISTQLKSVRESLPNTNLLLEKFHSAIESGQQLKMELKEEQLQQLRQLIAGNSESEIKQLAQAISTTQSVILGVEVKTRQRLERIETQLQELIQKQNQQNKASRLGLRSTNQGAWNYEWTLGIFGGVLVGACTVTAVVTRIVFGVAPAPLPAAVNEQIEYTREQVRYTNVKLQRVEKRLGTNRRK
ncbi:MAG: hypothetical protein KME57_21090 [Scytonema hyalinum WJT4-NPBG1]|jgi:hypothetical protein|nr:hypothetical protein [Scytonema hyalinum WJT4-NPBG1]